MADKADDVPGFEDIQTDAPQEAPVADSSPQEETKPEVAEQPKEEAEQTDGTPDTAAPEEPKETPEAETEADEDLTSPAADETPAEEQPLSKAEERKAQLNKEIRELVSARNAIKQSVEKQNEVYQPATEDELVQDGMSPEMAAIESMKQEREIEKYNSTVAENQLTIDTQAAKVLEDMPIFDPKSKDFKEEIARSTAQILQDNLIIDPNTGAVIGSNIEPYTLYSTVYNAYQASAVENQIKGKQATEKMLAEVDSPSSSGPGKDTKDPFMDGFDNPWGK